MAYPNYSYPFMGNYSPVTPFSGQQGVYPQQPQNVPPVQPQGQTQGFACRPVTSREEAVAYQIPFDGSTTYFVDTSNGRIYAKTFNFQNGTAPLEVYIRESEARPAAEYVTVDQFEELKAEVAELKKGRKVVKKDDE